MYDTGTSFKPLTLFNPVSIRNKDGTQPIVTDKTNRVFASSTLYGTGRIVVTTIPNTFNWALAGDREDYDNFWTGLLKKAAPAEAAEEAWSVSPAIPKVDEPVTINLETSRATVPHANVSGVPVYLENDPELSFRWSGTYWPVKAGWHPAVELNGSMFWWYVFNENEWKGVEANNKIVNTRRFADNSPAVAANREKPPKREKQEVPKILFFFLFITASGYLWIENKRSG
jgi:hypothetical protein